MVWPCQIAETAHRRCPGHAVGRSRTRQRRASRSEAAGPARARSRRPSGLAMASSGYLGYARYRLPAGCSEPEACGPNARPRIGAADLGDLARRESFSVEGRDTGYRPGTDPPCIVRCPTNCYRSGRRARHHQCRRLPRRAMGCDARGRCRRRRRSQSRELHRLERARRARRASQPPPT